MKFKEVKDHIDGSILKQQYLEAFLLQSTVIESLLKLLTGYYFWDEFSAKDRENPDSLLYKEVNKKLSNSGTYNQIELLKSGEKIKNELAGKLHRYRKQRNVVVHDLLEQINKETFEEELKDACKIGVQLFEDDEMSDLIEILEKRQ